MEADLKQEQVPVANQPAKSKIDISRLVIIAFLTASFGAVACYLFIVSNVDLNVTAFVNVVRRGTGKITAPTAVASDFASYKEVPVKYAPNVLAYSVKPDLSNLENAKDFELSAAAKKLLVANNFVVQPAWNQEFYATYESNRYAFTPNFVTTDSMLHNYHLVFDRLLRTIEETKLIEELKNLNRSMLASAQGQYNVLQNTPWEISAKRNLAFFAVGSRLLDPSAVIPDEVGAEVRQELALIDAHAGIANSVVMNLGRGQSTTINTPQGPLDLEALKEDYSQYIPRGHYDKSEALKAYFKSMMWYGRISFRFKEADEVRSAALISIALNDAKIAKSWDKIYEPTVFFVGASDDITFRQMSEAVSKAYGENLAVLAANLPKLAGLAGDDAKFKVLLEETAKLEPPKINSMPIFNAEIQPDREKEIKGFRFMGQRYTLDAGIFQQLIYRDVRENKTGEKRMLPKGLDIAAVMGASEAEKLLKEQGDFEYTRYPENFAGLKKYVAGIDKGLWTKNLYWGWLYSLVPLTTAKGEGWPSFMTNPAWARKELQTYLASWTELKHDTILYAKQVYAELGGGGEPEKKDDRGYVEPNPELYARLAGLLRMTIEGLTDRELLSDASKANLEKLETLALSLKTISEKELNNEGLNDEEYELIRSYGGQLEHFWQEVNREDVEKNYQGNWTAFLTDNPAALVTDVATDPNGTVLEEATGRVYQILVAVPVDGKLKLAKGTVFSYYEFPWPLDDRLTDKKWREEILDQNKAVQPAWTKIFTAE
jgi:hypothetical protein